jgi:hypothetical protein
MATGHGRRTPDLRAPPPAAERVRRPDRGLAHARPVIRRSRAGTVIPRQTGLPDTAAGRGAPLQDSRPTLRVAGISALSFQGAAAIRAVAWADLEYLAADEEQRVTVGASGARVRVRGCD